MTNPQSFNRYSYVLNDPVNFVDPRGLNPQDPLTPPTTPHIDPETGKQHPGGVPGPIETVDINIGRLSGTNPGFVGVFGSGDTGIVTVDPPIDEGGLVGAGQQDTPERTDWNSCGEFVDYLVALAVGAVINDSGSARITGVEIAASKLGIRMAGESFGNYHQYIGNDVRNFKAELIHKPQGAGVYAHVLGNAGLYLHGWNYRKSYTHWKSRN